MSAEATAPVAATTAAAQRRPFPWALLFHWFTVYLPLWGLLALVIFLVQLVLGAVLHEREDVMQMIKLLDRMPKIFKAFIGGDELMASNVLSIIAIGYQHPLVLIMLMINAVSVPTGLLTGQMEQGRMEMLLSRPITRDRVYLMSFILAQLSQAVLVVILFIGTSIWTRVFDFGEPIPLRGFVHVSFNLFALASATAGIATLAAVLLNERPRAIGWVITYLAASYLLDFSAVWLPRLEFIHPFTLHYYYVANKVLKAEGIIWGDVGVLFAVSAISTAIGYFYWRRRDLYTA